MIGDASRPTDSHYLNVVGVGLLMLLFSGCLYFPYCGLTGDGLVVRGRLADVSTETSLSGAFFGGRTITNGKVVSTVAAIIFDGTAQLPPTNDNGLFTIPFSVTTITRESSCYDPSSEIPEEFPDPDQVEITVIRDTCEFTFTIDVNADTVVDLSFPDDTLELKNPILVPACEGR